MKKMIIVSGQGNTGKTSAIKGAISVFCNVLAKPTGDITIITPIRKSGAVHHVGFASGGDTEEIVRSNIDFFEKHDWDCLVFACKSRGATLVLLKKFAGTKGISPIYINTLRQGMNAISAHTTKIVGQIASNIP